MESKRNWLDARLVLLERLLSRHGLPVYPIYSLALFILALALVYRQRDGLLLAVQSLGGLDSVLAIMLCVGILLLGFPWSRLGYASFDRITQAGLLWFVGPAASAVFNGIASLVFPFFIRRRTGFSVRAALIRAIHNVGMIMLMILAGGLAFSLAGGSYPVTGLRSDVVFPVACTILAMQLSNGFLLRVRLALEEGRLRLPVDVFSNALETAASLIGLLTAVIVTTTERPVSLSYLFVMLAMIYLVKRLSDSRYRLEEKVRERTAHIQAQNQRLEEAQTKQRALVRRLEKLSREDELTGLSNRRELNQLMRQERDRALRYQGELSLALIDVDHFKRVNDAHSHQVGDEVLCTIARLLEAEVRGTDHLGRWGGEEFLVVLPNTGLTGAMRVVERMRKVIDRHDWQDVVPDLALSISAGVAEMDADGDLERLFRSADTRLYIAKRQGRNQVVAGDETSA
ncbi:GGDEF domain-containing protein [Natronospira bacteriovora]|uniref:diguanylate cyclase n=1 Tax=Natronospira bacteriovora TaxID=3069753 RepID=A0ABU0W807_9GAMM|nr:GGDEF domain-containing protein [Natronospira sp. AB-CW4]MDQ2069595.1 GGDEF domain-containing protein [Natronospira sp. AB-CW4]